MSGGEGHSWKECLCVLSFAVSVIVVNCSCLSLPKSLLIRKFVGLRDPETGRPNLIVVLKGLDSCLGPLVSGQSV